MIRVPKVEWDSQKYKSYFTFRAPLYICTKAVYSKPRVGSYLGFDRNGVRKRQISRHFSEMSKNQENGSGRFGSVASKPGL